MNEENNQPHSEPLDEENEGFTRRGFVKVAIGGVCAAYGVAVGYPIYRYLNSPVEKAEAAAAVKEVNLKDADKLPKGTALVFKFGTHPSLLIHHDDDTWVALDAVCTHLGCTVQYNPQQKQIVCACHGGVYDAKTGENISGPPPKPLTKYVVNVQAGSVTVSRSA
ncbi:MAG: Rieske (2Fe-2S) protein [Armatimonadetes bacterium]|nr:Rieske (2Fe-2S) protein [Armatimonadota bacterium]